MDLNIISNSSSVNVLCLASPLVSISNLYALSIIPCLSPQFQHALIALICILREFGLEGRGLPWICFLKAFSYIFWVFNDLDFWERNLFDNSTNDISFFVCKYPCRYPSLFHLMFHGSTWIRLWDIFLYTIYENTHVNASFDSKHDHTRISYQQEKIEKEMQTLFARVAVALIKAHPRFLMTCEKMMTDTRPCDFDKFMKIFCPWWWGDFHFENSELFAFVFLFVCVFVLNFILYQGSTEQNILNLTKVSRSN